jgi:hypothetical protein
MQWEATIGFACVRTGVAGVIDEQLLTAQMHLPLLAAQIRRRFNSEVQHVAHAALKKTSRGVL